MIHVFTATGNSLHIAKEISDRTKQEIVFINSGKVTKDDDPTVFVVCPVYFYHIPVNVEKYVSQMKIDKSQKVVLVLNYGTTFGNAANDAVKQFSQFGIELNHVFAKKMPENWIVYFKVPEDSVIDQLLSSVPSFVDSMMEHLDDEKHIDDGKFKFMTPMAGWSYQIMRKTKKFAAEDSCISCGLCESICPEKIIRITNGKPEWTQPKCLQCLSCIHRCPESSIQFGKTQRKKRYVNPYVEIPSEF